MAQARAEAGRENRINPVLLPVMANRMDAVCREMTNTMLLAARSSVIGMARDLPLAQGLAAEHDLSVLLQSTRDRDEGLAAWREHRPPQFEGR